MSMLSDLLALRAAKVAGDGASAAADAADAAAQSASEAMSTTPEGYNDMVASLAEEFSASKAYTAGDYVWKDATLYRFKVDHAAGSWNAAHVDEAVLADDVTDLKSALSDKAPIIHNVVEGTYTDLAALGRLSNKPSSYTVTGIGLNHIVAFNSDQYVVDMSKWTKDSTNTLDITFHKDHMTLNGIKSTSNSIRFYTPDGGHNNYFVLNKPIPSGKTVRMCVLCKGSASGLNTDSNGVQFQFINSGTSVLDYRTARFAHGSYWISTFTPAQDVNRITLLLSIKENAEFENFEIYPLLWIREATTDEIVVQDGLASDVEYTFDTSKINSWDKLTTTPLIHTIDYYADTKTYIDAHIPDDYISTSNIGEYIPAEYVKESELTYLSPEMYGAVGNGITNDSTAVQACINAAISQNKPVRGYGSYNIGTTSLVIDCTNRDIHIERIVYTGSDAAIILAGKRNRFTFHSISATSQSEAVGISFVDSETTDLTERWVVEGNEIYANGNAIKTSGNNSQYYILIRCKIISSATADAIRNQKAGEFSVYDARFDCPSGWCINGNGKLFNCTMESNCYGGIYGATAVIQNCRAREMMDCLMPNSQYYNIKSGLLYKSKAADTNGQASININIDDVVYYDSIDLSEAIISEGSSGSSRNGFTGRVLCYIQYGDLTYRYGHYTIGRGMLIHGNDKICIPPYRSKLILNSDLIDLRDSNKGYGKFPFVTDFVVGVDDTIIYLSPSYCAEGYSDITLDMTEHMATVYDRRGNVIFDPTEYTDNGVYRLTAMIDPTIDDTYQQSQGAQYIYPINSGYCDVWTVIKIS